MEVQGVQAIVRKKIQGIPWYSPRRQRLANVLRPLRRIKFVAFLDINRDNAYEDDAIVNMYLIESSQVRINEEGSLPENDLAYRQLRTRANTLLKSPLTFREASWSVSNLK
jgi:hypothetical protein